MKKLMFCIALIAIVASMTLTSGCERIDMSEKNGPLTTRSYDNTGFTGVETGHAFELEITPADTYSVSITAGENLFDHIKVSQSDNILKIDTSGWSFSQWWGQKGPKVIVTMPVLTHLYLSGASRGTATGFTSDEDLTVKLSGASVLDLDMEVGYFTVEISGASNIKGLLTASGSDIELSGASDIDLTGSGGDIKLRASGASSAALLYFKAIDADVELSGASDASLDLSGRLDVKLSGSSNLKYAGNPTLGNVDVSSASDLEER